MRLVRRTRHSAWPAIMEWRRASVHADRPVLGEGIA